MGRSVIKRSKENVGAQFLNYFAPLLNALRKLGGSGTPDEVSEQIARDMALSDDVQNEVTPSGEPRFQKNVHWARFYLARDALIDSSKRGVWSLTEQGRSTHLTPDDVRRIFLRVQGRERAKKTGAEAVVTQIIEEPISPS